MKERNEKKRKKKKEKQRHGRVVTDTAKEDNEKVKRTPGKHGGYHGWTL